jgi:hypothetical protein
MERSFYLPGLRTHFESVLERLAAAPDHDPPVFLADIQRLLQQSQAVLARQRIHADQLSGSNRSIMNWLVFFAHPEHLRTYVSAVGQVQRAFESIHPARRRVRLPVSVQFRPLRALYQMRGRQPGTAVALPTPMVAFDPPLFKALAELATGHRQQRQIIQQAMLGKDYQALQSRLEDSGDTEGRTQGRCHDLAAAFARVNAAFFAAGLERPRLIWSRRLTRRKFGHYDATRDTVMVGSSLDDPEVPVYVVEFVLYHELLHKKHGITWHNGRARVHTPAFRREERRFPKQAEAEAWLARLARR